MITSVIDFDRIPALELRRISRQYDVSPTYVNAEGKRVYKATAALRAELTAALAPQAPEPAPADNVVTDKGVEVVEPAGEARVISKPGAALFPVKPDTLKGRKVAALWAGATLEEIHAIDGRPTPISYSAQRLAKRGYGVKLEGSVYKLILPAGFDAPLFK